MKKRAEYKKNTKGFTLVEMIVVVLIIGILAGLAAGGLIAYLRHAAFKKNNEYAQTIFTAAQTSLSQAREAGQLEELAEEIESDKSKILKKDMVSGGYEKEFPSEERLYYLIFDKKKADQYQGVYETVYDMIAPYIYDEDVLDAVYCIEFDPVDGVVWGVCYNDRAESFSYTGESTEKNNNITNREEGARREILLGYYGVDMLSGRAPGPQKKAIVKEFELVNDETLHLRWTLNKKYESMALLMEYQFELYQAQGDRIACSFKVNQKTASDSMVKGKGSAGITEDDLKITCDVSLYDEKGEKKEEELKDIPFRAYVEKNKDGKNEFHLVLDALDQKAAEQLEAVTSDYKDTYSIKRLKLAFLDELEQKNVDGKAVSSKLYVKMRAYGDKYKSAKWKTSSTQSAYFADEQLPVAEKASKEAEAVKNQVIYGISNPRHLSNIRFTEKNRENEIKSGNTIERRYEQRADMLWHEEVENAGAGEEAKEGQGIADHGNVFNGGVIVEAEKAAFPPVPALQNFSTYSGKYTEKEGEQIKEKRHTISGLLLQAAPMKEGEVVNEPVGIFGENNGSIQDVDILKATVKSVEPPNDAGEMKPVSDYLGMICGINNGKLENLSVDKESRITGRKFVGGICGADVTAKQLTADAGTTIFIGERSYKNLDNHADVTGTSYVGGILGYIYGINASGNGSADNAIEPIEKCNNTGLISSNETTGICIGGIVGYNKLTTIRECTNVVELEDEEKNGLLGAVQNHTVKGNFVGGIVGYNQRQADGNSNNEGNPDNNLIDCVNGKEDGKNQFIVGRNYVGGLAGVNVWSLDANEAGFPGTIISGKFLKSGKTDVENYADVAGEAYVGGIAGMNGKNNRMNQVNLADVFKTGVYDENVLFTPAQDEVLEMQAELQDSEAYISGYHSQGIVTAGKAYAGGITGYNTGIIDKCQVDYKNTAKEELQKRLKQAEEWGKDGSYVGGIAGYNNGYVGNGNEGQVLGITAVSAGKDYVGGLIGFNDINAQAIGYTLNDGCVQGSHFVGGYAGLNRSVNTPKMNVNTSETATVHFSSVEGDYFVGGYLGGNILASQSGIDEVQLGKIQNRDDAGKVVGTAFVGGYIGYNKLVGEEEDYNKLEIRDNLCSQLVQNENDPGVLLQSKVEAVKKGDEWSRDKLSFHILPLDASDLVKSKFESIEAGVYAGGIIGYNAGGSRIVIDRVSNASPVKTTASIVDNSEEDVSWKFAYGGGITGYVTKNMTVVQCRNEASNQMEKEEGEYLGSIAAVNAGTIRQCTAGDMKYDGKYHRVGGIVGYNKENALISECKVSGYIAGADIIGGLAAENAGTIDASKVEGSVSGNSTVGGISGDNSALISNSVQSADIKGKNNVGGLSGINRGTITACKTSGEPTAENGDTNVRKSVTGNENVGGYVGHQYGDLDGAVNTNKVSGSNNVGGIIGLLEDGGTITNCQNQEMVGSGQAGTIIAGGIVGAVRADEEAVKIENCDNRNNIIAGTNAGGIVGAILYGNNVEVELNGCTNIGAIQTEGTGSAGILGEVFSTSDTPAMSITNCRNYGVDKSINDSGDETEKGQVMSGILGQSNTTNLVLSQNYGVADCLYPVTNVNIGEQSDENYYFTAEPEEPEEPIKPDGTPVEPNEVKIRDLKNVSPVGGLNASNMFNNSLEHNNDFMYIHTDPAKSSIIQIEFDPGHILNSIDIFWESFSGKGDYDYTIELYKDKKGETPDEVYEVHRNYQEEILGVGGNEKEIPKHTDFKGNEIIRKMVIEIKPDLMRNNYVGIWEIYFNGQPVQKQGKQAQVSSEEAIQTYADATNKGYGLPLHITNENGQFHARNQKKGIDLLLPLDPLSTDPIDQYASLETRSNLWQALKEYLVTPSTVNYQTAPQLEAEEPAPEQNIPEPDVEPEAKPEGNPTPDSSDTENEQTELTPSDMTEIPVEESTFEHQSRVKERSVQDVEQKSTHTALRWTSQPQVSTYDLQLHADADTTYHLQASQTNDPAAPFQLTKETPEENEDGTQKWETLEPVTADDLDAFGRPIRTYTYEFGYDRQITGNTDAFTYDIPLKGRLVCTQPQEENAVCTWQLVLPDLTSYDGKASVYGNDIANYMFTSEVILSQTPADPAKNKPAFPMKWYRQAEENEDGSTRFTTKLEEVK